MKNCVFSMVGFIASGHAFAVEEIEFPFQKHYDIYIVSGNTTDEIEYSFDNDRPQHLIEKDFDGYTAWDYSFHTNDSSCELYEFSLDITYTLPQIVVSESVLEPADSFRAYIEKLYRHEQIHCALTLKSMHEIFLTFKNGQNGRCSEANRKVITLQSELTSNNEQFDAYTAHGDFELANSPFGEEEYLKFCEIPFEPIVVRV